MDARQQAAIARLSAPNALELSRMISEGQSNPAPGGEYPKMLYRKTEIEDRLKQTDAATSLSKQDTFLVQNSYDGLLCDITTANSADEAEAMAADGWDVSPKAAHGIAEGLVAATSAKDAEIAALRAQLAAANTPEMGGARRGPGRPQKDRDELVE